MRCLVLFTTVIFSLPLVVSGETETDHDDSSLSRSRSILESLLTKKRARKAVLEEKKEEETGDDKAKLWVVPPDPKDFEKWKVVRKDASADNFYTRPKALQSPTVVSDAQAAHGNAFTDFDKYTNSRGILTRPRSRSPFTKPGLWEPNPDDPHSRDPANKYWYHPESVGVDWLNGQLQWGAHWAVPAAGTGGTDGMSTLHFPSIGNLLNIPDDYD